MKSCFSVIAPSKGWIKENCELNGKVEQWIEKLPGPYTLILRLKNKDVIADNVAPGLDTVGIRIPDHWFSEVACMLDMPLVTTSANVVGDEFMTRAEALGILVEIIDRDSVHENAITERHGANLKRCIIGLVKWCNHPTISKWML